MDFFRFIDYLEKERRYSLHTVTAYRVDLEQFDKYLFSTFQENLSQATSHHIRSYMMYLSEQKTSAKTIARKISSIRSFYKYMFKQGCVSANPTTLIKTPKVPKKLPVFITDEKIENLLNSEVIFEQNFSGLRDKLVIEMLFDTGIRLSELINIKEEDVDFYYQTIKVLGKGKKERMIPMPQTLTLLIKKYIKSKNELEINLNNTNLVITNKGKETYPKFIYRIVLKYLSFVTTVNKKSPHVLRHTYATSLLNKGADLNAVKELLGHSSLAATQVYTHNSIEKIKTIYKQAHPKA